LRISPNADNARNFHSVTSLLGDNCGAHTFPYIEKPHRLKLNTKQQVKLAKTKFSIVTNVESLKKAIALIVNGFSNVLNKLPMEFAVEAQKLLEISLEGSVG
jgi:Fe-S cluster assembly protein SufB